MSHHSDPQEEAGLVERFISCDWEAGIHLYDKHLEKTCYYTRREIRNKEDANDICREALVAVLTNCKNGKLDNPASFRSYLYRICFNKINDYLREKYKKTGANSSEEFTDPETLLTLAQGLEKLDQQDQIIFHLRYIEGYSLKKIGIQLNLSYDTVRQRVSRGIAKLKTLLSSGEK